MMDFTCISKAGPIATLFVLYMSSDVCAIIMPKHDWTVKIAGHPFGIIEYDDPFGVIEDDLDPNRTNTRLVLGSYSPVMTFSVGAPIVAFYAIPIAALAGLTVLSAFIAVLARAFTTLDLTYRLRAALKQKKIDD